MSSIERGINHIKERDKILAEVIDSVDERPDFSNDKDHFHSLCMAIIYQQLSGSSASAIYERFLEKMDGDPTPERVAEAHWATLKSTGLSKQKRDYLKDLAEKCMDGTLELEDMEYMDDTAIIEELTKVKGIGEWTAQMFLMFSLERLDVFPVGDLGIRKGMAELYDVDDGDNKRLEELAYEWAPYRSIGSWYIWRSSEIDALGQDNW